jgi:hypothetical protein
MAHGLRLISHAASGHAQVRALKPDAAALMKACRAQDRQGPPHPPRGCSARLSF